jgi:hypothetical protein
MELLDSNVKDVGAIRYNTHINTTKGGQYDLTLCSPLRMRKNRFSCRRMGFKP